MKNLKVGLVTVTIISFLATACTHSDQQSLSSLNSNLKSGIVNGTDATDANIQASGFANPVVAIFSLLNEDTGMGALCSGTLIAPTIVLTAGHCVSDATSSTKIMVSFQTLDWSNGRSEANTVLAKSFVMHPSYAAAIANKTTDPVNDLALILLPSPAPATVVPARLSSSTDLAALGTVTTVGYGQSDDHQNAQDSGSGLLRFTEFTSQQVMSYSGDGPLNGMIVADAQNTSVCHGDSGGPLFAGSALSAQKIIVGVNDLVIPVYSGQEEADYQAAETSGDLKTFYDKYPDAHICLGYNAFVDVASHLVWINQTAAALIASH